MFHHPLSGSFLKTCVKQSSQRERFFWPLPSSGPLLLSLLFIIINIIYYIIVLMSFLQSFSPHSRCSRCVTLYGSFQVYSDYPSPSEKVYDQLRDGRRTPFKRPRVRSSGLPFCVFKSIALFFFFILVTGSKQTSSSPRGLAHRRSLFFFLTHIRK